MMELIVNEDWQTNSMVFYLRTNHGDRSEVIGQKDGKLLEQTLDRLSPTIQPIIPLLTMPISLGYEFLKSFSNFLSNKNIKTENENLLQGKLAATEKHLEDLRINFSKVLDKLIK